MSSNFRVFPYVCRYSMPSPASVGISCLPLFLSVFPVFIPAGISCLPLLPSVLRVFPYFCRYFVSSPISVGISCLPLLLSVFRLFAYLYRYFVSTRRLAALLPLTFFFFSSVTTPFSCLSFRSS